MPLCDAPAETQRWQAALFDLQRELKAELDTRIAIVQSLVRHADQRIEQLRQLESGAQPPNDPRQGALPSEEVSRISELARAGHTSTEIAEQLGVPIGDVELTIGHFGKR